MAFVSLSEPFTGELTGAELQLIVGGGWEPVALVCGDCSYDPGVQITSRRDNLPLTQMAQCLTRGQGLALERMRQQAAAAGAEGVIGVQLTMTDLGIAEEERHLTYHFSAVGTAVRRANASAGQPQRTFTSLLSGQDTWALADAGGVPLGVVVGFGACHVRTTIQRPTRCVEMDDLTAASYGAREAAMVALTSQAELLGATGVIGTGITLDLEIDKTVIFTAVGTAIRTSTADFTAPSPQMAMRLND